MGNLIVGEVSFELIAALRPLVPRIKRQDRSLADGEAAAARTLLERIIAMLWRLTRG